MEVVAPQLHPYFCCRHSCPSALRPCGSSQRRATCLSFHGLSEFLRGCPPSASALDSLKVSTYLGQSTKGWMLKVPLVSTVRSKQPNKAHMLTIRNDHPQNADFPQTYSRKEKKPFPVPIVELQRAARQRLKGRLPQRPISPARKGLTVKSLVPLAHNVLTTEPR